MRPFSLKVQPLWRKYFVIKTSLHVQYDITVDASLLIWVYTFFQALIRNMKVYNWRLYSDIIRHIFWPKIFNFGIQFIWINLTYIIRNLCRTILWCYCAIGKTLRYYKRSFIWRFIFVCSMVSERDSISDFIVIVNSMFILSGGIYIDLRLFSLTYSFPIHPIFYRENHITAKYQLDRTIIFLPVGCWANRKRCFSQNARPWVIFVNVGLLSIKILH